MTEVKEVEIRIAQYVWQELSEEQQAAVKTLAQKYAYDYGYDMHWEFFWIRFTPENWLIVNIQEQELMRKFRVA